MGSFVDFRASSRSPGFVRRLFLAHSEPGGCHYGRSWVRSSSFQPLPPGLAVIMAGVGFVCSLYAPSKKISERGIGRAGRIDECERAMSSLCPGGAALSLSDVSVTELSKIPMSTTLHYELWRAISKKQIVSKRICVSRVGPLRSMGLVCVRFLVGGLRGSAVPARWMRGRPAWPA